MRLWFAIGAAALQLVTLAWMAFEREWVVWNGETVHLRTAPVDPRDAFRGDYVRLDYEINHAPRSLLRDGLARTNLSDIARDSRVYAVLRREGDLASLDYVTDRKPDSGLFLRGRADRSWTPSLQVRYGIEAFFVEQGKGLEIERGRMEGDVQIPIEMQVAISDHGIGVLTGYRWSALGIGLSVENEPLEIRRNDRVVTNRVARRVGVILQNVSSNDLAIVDLPGGQSLALERDVFRSSGSESWTWVGNASPRPAVTDEHVRLLKPRQKHTIRVDLADPAWFVAEPGGKPQRISGLPWGVMFRLVYRPPPADACRHLQHADRIWHGYLMSRAFDGGGRWD